MHQNYIIESAIVPDAAILVAPAPVYASSSIDEKPHWLIYL